MRSHARWLVLPIVALGLYLWLQASQLWVEAPARLLLGPTAAQVRQIDLRFRRAGSDEIVRETTLRFPQGAPAEVFRRLRLPRGELEAGVRLVLADGQQRPLTRRLVVVDDRVLQIDLAP